MVSILIYPGIEDDEVLNTGTSEDDHKTKECLQKGEPSQRKHKFDFFDNTQRLQIWSGKELLWIFSLQNACRFYSDTGLISVNF